MEGSATLQYILADTSFYSGRLEPAANEVWTLEKFLRRDSTGRRAH